MSPRRIALVLPVCLGLMLASTAGVRADQLDPAASAALLQKLHDAHAKNPNLEATFTQARTSHLLNKPVLSEGMMDFSAPNKFRQEVRTPAPSTTTSDGKTMWIYYPAFKEVEVYELGDHSILEESLEALTAGLNFEHIDEYYNYSAYQDPSGYRLDMTPKKPSLRKVVTEINLILSPEFMPVSTEITLPKGDRVVTHYHDAHRPALPASMFVFQPPADAHVTHVRMH